MLARVVEQADYVMVIETVEREAADPPNSDEASRTKKAQLVRHSRLRQFHQCGQVADATFTVRERVEQTDTRGIAQ